MKVLAIVGSPRRGGNTDILSDRVLAGAASCGHDVKKVWAYDLELRPCIDCRKCQGGQHECFIRDDMERIYGELSDSDVIVFGTPLYWYGTTAPMKALIDRLRPFASSRALLGKKAIVVTPSEEGPDACAHLMGMLELSFNYLGVELIGRILPKAYEKGEVRDQPDVLEVAYRMGNAIGRN